MTIWWKNSNMLQNCYVGFHGTAYFMGQIAGSARLLRPIAICRFNCYEQSMPKVLRRWKLCIYSTSTSSSSWHLSSVECWLMFCNCPLNKVIVIKTTLYDGIHLMMWTKWTRWYETYWGSSTFYMHRTEHGHLKKSSTFNIIYRKINTISINN